MGISCVLNAFQLRKSARICRLIRRRFLGGSHQFLGYNLAGYPSITQLIEFCVYLMGWVHPR